ncbi:hypothetical protein L226DRAFT_612066 [Lentinus tigrinus ALCF2SS1-7]|uniref:Uncharacterized protein n=1 Tax=Lentinus tigrinus ALCF2SS1-6 TaxID=1328759 RepID=A0A5C2SBH5_9APHY|nr:hypothetical protein L227DRAFT_653209 [Lentinus tigrinus ALCF2SS1-6]RPD75746.1 hypothetical protein L226DRAFT_612066 [Lentinus tigrinus ALCF2SS1-7]
MSGVREQVDRLSTECQKAAWNGGHKHGCKFYRTGRDRATELSGDPKAWANMMEWVRYHHSSLMNATLAECIRTTQQTGESFRDVSSSYFLQVSVAYRADPSLPIEQKFELRGTHFVRRDDPMSQGIAPFVEVGRQGAVKMGQMECGSEYAGTGSYLVVARFRPNDMSYYAGSGQDGIPFVKHFGVNRDYACAKLACRHPLAQLQDNISSGRKMRFCCGRTPRDDTCCCGGWTHELMRLDADIKAVKVEDDDVD